jgi:peptidoglycan/xylan/chitin deacetylase (PgdA/CDA1 family)
MEKLGWSPDGAKVLKEWTDAGHLVANHTWSHPDLHRVPAQKYILEIEKNDQLLTTGFKNEFIRLFRYPFLHEGETLEKRNLVREALKSTGYQIAQVTVDFNDYLWNEPYLRCLKIRNSSKLQWLEKTFLSESAENLRGAEILARLLFDHPIKQIALVHPFELDSMKLDQMLTEWARTGVKFIPLRDAMKDPIYQINPNIAGANWTFLNQIRIARKIENSPELSQIYDHSARLAVELSKTCR